MGQRSAHGTAKACESPPVQLETLPVVELPDGEPARADDVSRGAAGERGQFRPKNRRSVLGGRSHKGKPRLVERIALTPPAASLPTHRYHVAAKAMVIAVRSSLKENVGGGLLDPHVGYLLTAAGRAAKWANYFSDLAERMQEGSKDQRETVAAALGADEKASSHLRNAHEYAARMAEARAAHPDPSRPLPGFEFVEEPAR
jgi:hypothetical protein